MPVKKENFPLTNFLIDIESKKLKIDNNDLNNLRPNLTYTIKNYLTNKIIWNPLYIESHVTIVKAFLSGKQREI